MRVRSSSLYKIEHQSDFIFNLLLFCTFLFFVLLVCLILFPSPQVIITIAIIYMFAPIVMGFILLLTSYSLAESISQLIDNSRH